MSGRIRPAGSLAWVRVDAGVPAAPSHGMRIMLSTARLDLAAVAFDDLEELHQIFSDPRTHSIGDGPFQDIRETEDWITRRLACQRDFGLCWYAVRERSARRLVGNCGIFPGRTGPNEPEIGYEIRHDCRRLGYATEAAAAVMTECARAGLPRVWATVRPANRASQHVLRRLGMVFQHCGSDQKGALLYLSRSS